ncbi:sulfatase-like hydrolase/transferase [Halorubrum ezzemoulense]|uniref:Arylsulfatase n=1 Tax=Halorubrum ezzemoulense TaxID=337243 RepID=A0A481RES8_HALEZ|nr:sulfatase-like hydrolase/transferase [Halorubrum ezzemoulense]QAY19737.1 arylsulfatase [Halorubrum ezzemoulense]
MGDPNVLLVVLDSVRASNCSLYGHANETTPFLDSFGADRATVYDQARAPGARSVTSHVSLFSGLHVAEHGVVSAAERLDPTVSVFHRLREDGYDTGIFTENDWVTAVDVGLKNGFDTVVGARNVPFPDALNPHEFVSNQGRGAYGAFVRTALASDRPGRSLVNGVSTKLQSDFMRYLPGRVKASTPADVYVDAFLEWSEESEGPWAACLNLMDAHIPYEPAAEHDLWGGNRASELQSAFEDQKWAFHGGQRPWWQKKAVESLYDGAIRQMDAELERLVAALEVREELDDTLLVVTSDHGEGFGEPSRLQDGVRIAEHGVSVHDAVVHVPLLVRYPGQTTPHRIERPATLTAFPDVVNRFRDGDRPDAGFCPDEPVITTAVGLDEPLQKRASNYVEDISPWVDTKRAVFEYDEHEGVVEKYCRVGDTAATIRVRDAQTDYRVAGTDDGRVDAAFDAFERLDVRTDGEDLNDLDDETYGRLEDLGYV